MNFTIETERIVLRPPLEVDDEKLFELMAEPRITKFLTWEPHQNLDTTKAVTNGLRNSIDTDAGYHWCIILDGVVIGLISLIDVKRTIRTWTLNRAELSYWISPDYQGKGFATESAKSILKFGFEKLNFNKIIVAHAEENTASKSICKKLGFTQYALEHDAFEKNGKWHNLIWYELLNKKK